MTTPAAKGDWQTQDLPPKRRTVRLDRTFSPQEMRRMKLGLVPEQMEDKWFVYWQGDALYFHRSWSEFCIYVVRFDANGDSHRMFEADLNREPDQYDQTDDDHDAAMISYLIDVLLLDREADFPTDAADPGEAALQQWSEVGRAMLGERPEQSLEEFQRAPGNEHVETGPELPSSLPLMRRKDVLARLGVQKIPARWAWSHDLGDAIAFDAWEDGWERGRGGHLIRYPLRTNGPHYNLDESRTNPRKGHTRWQSHVDSVIAGERRPRAFIPVSNDPSAKPNKGAKGWLPLVVDGHVEVDEQGQAWLYADHVEQLQESPVGVRAGGMLMPPDGEPLGSTGTADYFYYNTDAGALTGPPSPRFRLLIDGGFAAVGGDRQKFGEQLGQLSPDDILLMYENGIGVVAVGRVREKWDGVSHTAPRYYNLAEMGGLTGGEFEYRIAVDWFLDLSEAPAGIDELRQRFGYKSGAAITRGTVDKIVKQRQEIARLIEEWSAGQSLLPGEIGRPASYVEGATRRVAVNAYERSRKAVLECKAKQGTACVACGMDFATRYGPEFAGFIHVHHLRPLSEVGGEYTVDPDTDLRPVCPNCHAVIHHGGRLRGIDEVRQLMGRQRDAKPSAAEDDEV